MENLTNENIHSSLENLKLKQLALQEKSKKMKENIVKINAHLQNLVKAFFEINNDIIHINEELEKNAVLITHLQDICVQASTNPTEAISGSEISKDNSNSISKCKSFLEGTIKKCANLFSVENGYDTSTTNKAFSQIQNVSIEKPIILREITEYNKYYDAFEKFEKSCKIHGVSIYSSTNLYTLLLSLKRKRLCITLEKDGYEQFCPKDGVYQGSEEWVEKWNKIIFSPDITPKEFLRSLEYIFIEHGIESIKHLYRKNLVNFNQWEINSQLELREDTKTDLIRNHNYYIYIGLYLMHYVMTISNEEATSECIVTNSQDIKNRNQISVDAFLTKKTENFEIELSDCCYIVRPSHTDDSDISENEKDLHIVFTEDIISNTPSLRYRTSSYLKEEELIVSNDIVLSKTDITAISLWHSTTCHASDEVVILKGINNNVSQEFLFLYLRTLFAYCSSLGYNVKSSFSSYLGKLKISVPPRHIQKQFISDFRNDPTIDLAETLQKIHPNIFENLEKEVQYLLTKETDDNQIIPISSYSSCSYGLEYVRGHYRKGGIYVRGHYRRK